MWCLSTYMIFAQRICYASCGTFTFSTYPCLKRQGLLKQYITSRHIKVISPTTLVLSQIYHFPYFKSSRSSTFRTPTPPFSCISQTLLPYLHRPSRNIPTLGLQICKAAACTNTLISSTCASRSTPLPRLFHDLSERSASVERVLRTECCTSQIDTSTSSRQNLARRASKKMSWLTFSVWIRLKGVLPDPKTIIGPGIRVESEVCVNRSFVRSGSSCR